MRVGFLAALLLACPAEVAVAPRSVAPVVAPPTPIESPARWILDGVSFDVRGEHRLADGSTVVVGAQGGRALVTASSARGVSADIHEDLVGAVEFGKSLAFVGASGAIYVSETPLGRVTNRRAVPTGTSAFSVAHNAILAVTDRSLVRSIDGGVTFTPPSIALAPRLVADVVAHGSKVVAIAFPQAVYLSTDDGASFQQIPTIGQGVSAISRYDNQIFVTGASGKPFNTTVSMLLDEKNHLVEATPPSEYAPARTWPAGPGLHLTDGAPFGAKPPVTDPEPAGQLSPDVIEYAVRPPRVVGGPSGFLFLNARCPTPTTCGAARVRLKAGGPLQNVQLLDAKGAKSKLQEIVAVVVVGRAVHALVWAGANRVELFSGSVDDVRWRSRGVFDRDGRWWSLDADDDGTLMIGALSSHKSLQIGVVPPDGSPATTKFGEALAAVRGYAFAGKRGFATSDKRAWETDDHGLHWRGTVGPFGVVKSCGSHGCIVGTNVRIGWDLPREPETEIAKLPGPEAIRPAGKPIECKLTGAWKHLMEWSPYYGRTPDYESEIVHFGFSIEHAQPAADVVWAVNAGGNRISAMVTPKGIQLQSKPLPKPKVAAKPVSDDEGMYIPSAQPMALGPDVTTKVGASLVRVRFSEMRSHTDFPILWSHDNFKTWSLAHWSMGPLNGAHVVDLQTGPALVVWENSVHAHSHFAIPLPEDHAPDPPSVSPLSLGAALVAPEVVCDKAALFRQHIDAAGSKHEVTVTGDGAPIAMETTEATVHFDGSAACVGIYAAGDDDVSALIPLYDPKASTAFRRRQHEYNSTIDWRPMTCVVTTK
jgi:hypothetical protein